MERFQVWVDLQDRRYARRLMEFLTVRYGNRMQVYPMGKRGVQADGKGILLTDRHTQEERYGRVVLVSAVEGVNPYQSGHQIARIILEKYAEDDTKEPVIKGQGEWVSVYSPVGGIGTTTLAMGLSQVLADQGKRVLHLALEGPSAWILYYQYPYAYTMSDLFYCFLLEQEQSGKQLEEMVYQQKNGVYFLPPCLYLDDLLEFTQEEMIRWMAVLSSHFDYVIADLGSQMFRPFQIILENSTQVCYLLDARPEAMAKWQDVQVCHLKKENSHIFCRHEGRGQTDEIYLPEETELFDVQEGKKRFHSGSMYIRCLEGAVAAWS